MAGLNLFSGSQRLTVLLQETQAPSDLANVATGDLRKTPAMSSIVQEVFTAAGRSQSVCD
jgi:hypothetical protein